MYIQKEKIITSTAEVQYDISAINLWGFVKWDICPIKSSQTFSNNYFHTKIRIKGGELVENVLLVLMNFFLILFDTWVLK